jgi:hypothetical protein
MSGDLLPIVRLQRGKGTALVRSRQEYLPLRAQHMKQLNCRIHASSFERLHNDDENFASPKALNKTCS